MVTKQNNNKISTCACCKEFILENQNKFVFNCFNDKFIFWKKPKEEVLCEKCFKKLYKEMGKIVTPKSPKSVIVKDNKIKEIAFDEIK